MSDAPNSARRAKRWPRALLLVAGLLLAAQLLPFGRPSNPAVTLDIPAPVPIKNLLRKACYDCHSNQTEWPWYAKLAPLSWWIAHHVDEGREHVNFSTWDAYGEERRAHLLRECAEEIRAGKMPLPSYTWMHEVWTELEREQVLAWIRSGAKKD